VQGSHGGTEPRRKSVVAMAVLCRAKGNAEGLRCPRMDANPREWKTRVGSDRRTDPKFRRAAPHGGKKDSHRDAESGERRAESGERKPESSGILKKFRGRCAGLKAQGGWASRPPRVGFVGGTPTLLEVTVFYNSRAKAGRCPRMGEKGTGLSRRHGENPL
jgi:hypothetical protein